MLHKSLGYVGLWRESLYRPGSQMGRCSRMGQESGVNRSVCHFFVQTHVVSHHTLDGEPSLEDFTTSRSIDQRQSCHRLHHFADRVADITGHTMLDDFWNRTSS